MSEYTSLEVSKRLAEAGFSEGADGRWVGRDGRPVLWKKPALPILPIPGNDVYLTLAYAYRSDTLLDWLLNRGLSVTVVKGGGGFMYASVNYFTQSGETLADALAGQVLKVLEVSHV